MTKAELIDLSYLNMSDEELFAHVDNSSLASEKITAPRYSYWHAVFKAFFKKKSNIIFLILLALVIIFAVIYPSIIHYDKNENSLLPGCQHLSASAAIAKFGFDIKWIFGTGSVGQSVFNELWDGARLSIALSFLCAAINMTIGIIIGAIWGFSKKFDLIMMEVYNIVGNVPYVLLISVFVLIMSPTFWTMVFALTITGWLGIAYFFRTQVMIIRDREYNLASRCLGTPMRRLVFKNILPYMTSIIMTLLATELPAYISYEVFLSYIGMGLSDNSLGKIIDSSTASMMTPGWEKEFWAPVIVASIITIVLYVVGQSLGDASDPKTHR